MEVRDWQERGRGHVRVASITPGGILLGALLSSVCGGLVVAAFQSGDEPAPTVPLVEKTDGLSEQVAELRKRVDRLATARPPRAPDGESVRTRDKPSGKQPSKSSETIGREVVRDVVEDEHQRQLDRKIGLSQAADVRAVDRFVEKDPTVAAASDDLKSALFTTTECYLEFLDEGQRALRDWAEVRSDMDACQSAGVAQVEELLSEEQLRSFAKITVDSGTTLFLDDPSSEPKEGVEPMEMK